MLSEQLIEEIIKNLYSKIPEFETYGIGYLDDESINGYMALDYFGSFLKDLLVKNTSKELIDRCYHYINELCENRDREIENWIKVTFLESMVEKGKPIDVSKIKLTGRALIFFEEVLNGPMFGSGRYIS